MTRFALYQCRWQLSTPILWGVLQYLGQGVGATVIANLIGGCAFYLVDKKNTYERDKMKSPTLEGADQIIHGERQDMYGSPEDCFDLIADYWNTYILAKDEICLDASDVAILMTLFKIARMSGQKWHHDNAVDACGYLAILNDRIKGGAA